MLTLSENQICQHSNNCPHNQDRTCHGSYSNRNSVFTCNLVNESGNFNENNYMQRNPHDRTGNMKIIME